MDAIGWNVCDNGYVDVKDLKVQSVHIDEVFVC